MRGARAKPDFPSTGVFCDGFMLGIVSDNTL
jgi:hypothetical protein